jgi:hypothetical protein
MRYGNYKVIEGLKSNRSGWRGNYIEDGKPTQGGFMNEMQNMENRLWDYIDGLSPVAEKSAIHDLIESNGEWRQKYEELLEQHRLLGSTELDAPSLRFTKNVMELIAKHQIAPATESYLNKKIIGGIGGFFLVMIFGMLIYGFGNLRFTSTGSTDYLSKIPTFKLDWNKFFSNDWINVLLMVNVVLGLVLLDMFLQHRRKQGMPKSN